MDGLGTLLPGLVTASFGRQFSVEIGDGRVIPCVTHGRKADIACGDRVSIRMTSPTQGVIDSVAPRRSLLFRSDVRRQKVIAANVTQIVIVVAAVPSFYEDLLNRCLVAAEAGSIRALIVLNKIDLPESARALEVLQLYRMLGYLLLPLSANQDVEPLRHYLSGHTSVLVGQSGMGKSSIINALLPQAQVRTCDISTALDSGRHTTTHTKLYHVDPDSQLIDSPGLQEFGLNHLSPTEICQAFVEFRPFLGQCKFNNCRHLSEPGCRILAAAASGAISARRLAVYHKLIKSH